MINPANNPQNEQLNNIVRLLQDNQPTTVLTGAGISVSSGLPVYRDSKGNWVHSKPVQGAEFRSQQKIRQRYWSRSYLGWPAFSCAKPNSAHTDLAALQQHKRVSTIITQNVDGLHQAAGSKDAVALHGSLSEVICLNCGDISAREKLQHRLQQSNKHFQPPDVALAPDGDAQIDDDYIEKFNIVNCEHCDGLLKPNVVFFGDNVPKDRVQDCIDKLLQSKLLICIGTSLMVFSGFRFCRIAREHNIPIVIINDGVTRADDIASIKYDGELAGVLTALRRELA